jgi:COP9 signalosome complex subunit 7
LLKLHFSQELELEDFLIESIYTGLVIGKLDQLTKSFNVSFTTARDVRPESINDQIEKLQSWKEKCSWLKVLLTSNNRYGQSVFV